MPLNLIAIEHESDIKTSVLKQAAKEVSFPLSREDKDIIEQMKEMLYHFEGVGLAAPQVGVNKKIALIYIPESAALLRENATIVPLHVIINPEYSPIDPADKYQDFESCYSVESVMGKVLRFRTISLKYQNEEGEVIQKLVEGFYARVLQHEIDHLNGILLTDRLTADCLQGDKKNMFKIRRAELSPEKRKYFDQLVKKKGVIIDDE